MPHRGSPVSLLTAVRADFSRPRFCGLLASSGAAGRPRLEFAYWL